MLARGGVGEGTGRPRACVGVGVLCGTEGGSKGSVEVMMMMMLL